MADNLGVEGQNLVIDGSVMGPPWTVQPKTKKSWAMYSGYPNMAGKYYGTYIIKQLNTLSGWYWWRQVVEEKNTFVEEV